MTLTAMNKEYFEANVNMSVEIEYEMGGRCWHTMKGNEVKAFCDSYNDSDDYVSDIDYCSKQTDDYCRKVLNTAYFNWTKNLDWVKAQKITNLWDLIDFVLDHDLVQRSLTREELNKLDAHEVKTSDARLKDAKYLGAVMSSYGDWNYYQCKDGSFVCTYFSIGD